MKRIRIKLPKNRQERYNNLDIIHDAIINAFFERGASKDQIIGPNAALWNFATLGWHNKTHNAAHTLIISTSDEKLSIVLDKIKPEDIKASRQFTSEYVNFSLGIKEEDILPIFPGQNQLGVLMLSPLAVSHKVNEKRMWYKKIHQFDHSAAINARLSRCTGKSVNLTIIPDPIYIKCTPRYDTLVQIKKYPNGKRGFVIGMRLPLILHGSEEDLALAWYSGIGEKTRSGFGCIDIAERGIGR